MDSTVDVSTSVILSPEFLCHLLVKTGQTWRTIAIWKEQTLNPVSIFLPLCLLALLVSGHDAGSLGKLLMVP